MVYTHVVDRGGRRVMKPPDRIALPMSRRPIPAGGGPPLRARVDGRAGRPPGAFLTAEWRDLAMLNYEIDPAILRARVPSGTELDAWNGRTFVSVVAFRFVDTRVLGMAIPRHRNFEELNLRFYVRRKAAEGWRRGVVFVKEIVPRRAIAWLARAIYDENYAALPMRHRLAPTSCSQRAVYEWFHAKRWNLLTLDFDGTPYVPSDDSEETFITEHYWGYARRRDGGTIEYRVEHPRWPVLRATAATLDCDVSTLYGPEFASFLCVAPSSAFMAEGSPIIVRRKVRL
jgi:uncharacterized protein YqjF (DUF2071 family)